MHYQRHSVKHVVTKDHLILGIYKRKGKAFFIDDLMSIISLIEKMLHLSKENDVRNAYTYFLVSNPIFGVNVRVAEQIYVFKVKFSISKGIKATICKINNFSIVLVSALNATVDN